MIHGLVTWMTLQGIGILPLPPIRIKFGVGGKSPSFYIDDGNATPFVPRGVNFNRPNASIGGTDPVTDPARPTHHALFAPGRYNGTAAKNMLRSLVNDGYNIVRVFLDHGAMHR